MSRIVLVLVAVIVLLLGIGLLFGTAWHREKVNQETAEAVLHSIVEIVPGFTAAQQNRVKTALQTWQERLWTETLGGIVLRDIGIAMIVAFFLTFGIEMYARSRLQDEIRSGVVEAAFARLIPEAVFSDVRTHILSAPLLKEAWTFDMTVFEDAAISVSHSGALVATTVQTYRLRNLTSTDVRHDFAVELDRDVVGNDSDEKPLPRFEKVRLGTVPYEGAELAKRLAKDGSLFSQSVTVGDTPLDVEVHLSEIIQIPDTFVWSTRMCTDGARIKIQLVRQDDVRFEVTALHPDRNRLKTGLRGNWQFVGGILPWQGFQIRTWRESHRE